MKYNSNFLFSLLLHMLVLLCLIRIAWQHHHNTGFKNTVIIRSYLYALPQSVVSPSTSTPLKTATRNRTLLRNKKNVILRQSQLPQLSHLKTQLSANLSQGSYHQLLIALHNAIAQKEIFPVDAAMLGERGEVALHFLLHTTGAITNIVIVKSSGFTVLDNAAISALKKIAPFTAIKVYKTLKLTIRIRFR